MTESEKIVFLGSGSVAERSLDFLSRLFPIEAVITKPSTTDRMRAICKEATVYSVTSKAELDDLIKADAFESRLAVLVDFGIIVSKEVIDSFDKGIINSHFSLLPQWRGADPITFAILSGQQVTGVSLMLVSPGLDEGPLIGQAECVIPDNATTADLTSELIDLSNAMLETLIPLYLTGSAEPVSQNQASLLKDRSPSYSRKITKEDGIIDWHKHADELERQVRAFSEWPKSKTELANRMIIIVEAKAVDELHGEPGTPVIKGKRLFVYCGKGALEIIRIKPADKKEMSAQAFLAGYSKLLIR